MQTICRLLAPGAGTTKRGLLRTAALRGLPLLALSLAVVLGTPAEADAKARKGWHGAQHGTAAAAAARQRKAASRRARRAVAARPSSHRARLSRRAPLRTAMKLGGPVAAKAIREASGSGAVHQASLGAGQEGSPAEAPESLSGGTRLTWRANAGCLADELKPVLAHIAANFGTVRVNSTCRSHAHNRRVGGARRSFHLTGRAADFRLDGNVAATLAYLRKTSVGGIKHYGSGVFHIDTGPRRTW